MLVKELIAKLRALYPQSYPTGEAVTEWGSIAQTTLGRYAGPVLRAAYNELMGSWDKGYSPRPSDFLPACNSKTAATERSEAGGRNMKRFSDELQRLRPALVAEYFSQNSELIDGWIAERPDLDPKIERFALLKKIEDLAHEVAQQQILEQGGQIVFGPEDLEKHRASRDQWNETWAKDMGRKTFGPILGRALRKSPWDQGGEPAREIVG